MFWIGGRLREVVAHEGSTELTNCLRGLAEHNRYKKICNLWTPLNTRNLAGTPSTFPWKPKLNVTDSTARAVFGGKANMANRWASLLLVLSLASRDFSPGAPVFPSPQKPTRNSNSIWNSRTRLNEFIWTPICASRGNKQFFLNENICLNGWKGLIHTVPLNVREFVHEKLKTEILYKRNNLSLVLLSWSEVSILSSH